MKKLLALMSGIVVIIICLSLGVMKLSSMENTQMNSSSKKVQKTHKRIAVVRKC